MSLVLEAPGDLGREEDHLGSNINRISQEEFFCWFAFCLKKKKKNNNETTYKPINRIPACRCHLFNEVLEKQKLHYSWWFIARGVQGNSLMWAIHFLVLSIPNHLSRRGCVSLTLAAFSGLGFHLLNRSQHIVYSGPQLRQHSGIPFLALPSPFLLLQPPPSGICRSTQAV